MMDVRDPVMEWLDEVERKEAAGILKFREAPFGFLRMTSGKHAGRIAIRSHPFPQVDSKPVTWLAPTLTWVYLDDLMDCTCERVSWGAT